MTKSVFRPFWSLDIIETENWLCEMSTYGYYLKEIKTSTKVFVFDIDEIEEIQYKICYHKKGINIASGSLFNNGWNSVFTKGKWSILANKNDKSKIKTHPSRESLLNRSRFIKYTLGSLLAMWFVMSLMPMIFLTELLFDFNNTTLNNTFMPGAKLSMIIILLILLLLIYIIIKLYKSDRKLLAENTLGTKLSFTIVKDEISDYISERELINNGKAIKKFKLGWIYSPDKIEEWLENMEIQGYNLYRMNGAGNTFYFKKGNARNIKYSLDFQVKVNESYFEIHKSNGWNMMFTSSSSFVKHTLWCKEYSWQKPALYSDTSHLLKHARNQCMFYCILFTPLTIMYLFLIISNIKLHLKDFTINWILFITLTLCMIQFGNIITKSLSYYIRTKKKIS